jgi:23S rRNA (guanosine2251-2'-O)-methyltransferase
MRFIILDSIRSEYNVGAIFRTADAAGVTTIYLCGYTPAPIDRFGRVVTAIQKTSLGASATVSWEQVPDCMTALAMVRRRGAEVVAVEQGAGSISLYEYTPKPNVAYVFGNETTGVSADVLSASDVILEIPMVGMKESLNVSVTAGVVLLQHPYESP